jgi:hypothetical protein
MAKLWLSLSAQRVLEPYRYLMFRIGNLISSMVTILSLKSKMISYSFMVLTPRMTSYCGLLNLSYSTMSGDARYLLLLEYSKKLSSISAFFVV